MTYLDRKASTPEVSSPEGGTIVLDPDVEMTQLSAVGGAAGLGAGPVQREHVLFTNNAGNLEVGVRDSTATDVEMAPFPWHEWAQVLEGEVWIIEEGGSEHVFRKGDVLFASNGTVCRRKIDSHLRNSYGLLGVG
jgi:uncharacterized cupin superfamily protein